MMPSGWDSLPLGEVVNYKKGFAFKSENFKDSGRRIIRISDTTASSIKNDSPVFVNEDSSLKDFELSPNDIILSTVGSRPPLYDSMVGKAIKVPSSVNGAYLNQNLVKLIPDETVDRDFLFLKLKEPRFISYISTLVRGNANQVSITLDELFNYQLLLPSKNEQEKIAKILSTWDETIEKLDAATKLVSGLKQNLLHQIIYKNQFHHKAEWSLKPVSELFDILDSKRKPLNSSQRQNMKGDVPYYGANGQVGTVDDFIFNEPLILLAEDGGYFDEYKTRPIAYRIFGKSWVNNHAHVLKAKESFNFDYLYFAFVHKNIMPFLNGGTRAKLNKAVLEKIEIPIPNRPDEQKAIANLFNSLEQRESLLKQKTSLLQIQKQGLMQQLLTGKKRVKV